MRRWHGDDECENVVNECVERLRKRNERGDSDQTLQMCADIACVNPEAGMTWQENCPLDNPFRAMLQLELQIDKISVD